MNPNAGLSKAAMERKLLARQAAFNYARWNLASKFGLPLLVIGAVWLVYGNVSVITLAVLLLSHVLVHLFIVSQLRELLTRSKKLRAAVEWLKDHPADLAASLKAWRQGVYDLNAQPWDSISAPLKSPYAEAIALHWAVDDIQPTWWNQVQRVASLEASRRLRQTAKLYLGRA